MFNTLISLYSMNEDVDKMFLFTHLKFYLISKPETLRCLEMIVDGNIFEFDVNDLVVIMRNN